MLSGLLFALLGQACFGPVPAARSLSEDEERFVRLESRAGEPRSESVSPVAHPVSLSPAEWTRILTSIRIQSRKDSFLFTTALEPPTEAFDADEIVYLSRMLSETFARAGPNEWVVFGMSRVLPSGVNEITTGGWFAEGTRLHLLLANYHHSATRSAIREQLWRAPLRAVAAPFYEVIQGDHQTATQNRGLFGGVLAGGGPELVIEYRALLDTPPVGGPRPAAAAGETTPSPQEPDRLPPAAVEERLRVLKRLRDQGLITEQEYREKKKEVLGSF